MLDSAHLCKYDENSTPIISLKGKAKAYSKTAPLPEPKSTNVKFETSIGKAAMIASKVARDVGP